MENRKMLYGMVAFLFLLTLPISAQINKACIIQLKNGSEVMGKVTDITPNESVTLITPQNQSFIIYNVNIKSVKQLRCGIVDWSLGRTSVQVNPIGFLQFGPSIQIDTRIKGNTFIGTGIRFSKSGYAYRYLSKTKFACRIPPSEIAASLSITKFFDRAASPNKFYFSLIGEYSQGKSAGPDRLSLSWQGENSEISMLAGVGHRWRFNSGFFMNIGLAAGVSKGMSDNWWYTSAPDNRLKRSNKIYFPAMVVWALGWEI